MTEYDEPLEPIPLGQSDPWGAPPPAGSRSSHHGLSAAVVALVIAMIIAGLTGYFVTSATRTGKSVQSANALPADPRRSALTAIVVQRQDVTDDYIVGLINDGDRLTEPTLDLCNGTFPSEKLRTSMIASSPSGMAFRPAVT